jgi:hypothetical protein
MTASAIAGNFVLAVLWLIAIWRIPTRRSSARQRATFVAFLGFPLAYTINQPAVTRFVDAVAGIPDLAVLAKHMLGMTAAGAALEALRAVTAQPGEPQRYWRQRLLVGATMVAMILLFATIPRNAGGEDFVTDRSTMPTVTAYGLLYQVTLGALVVTATRLFGRHWRRAPAGPPRAGLLLIACGMAVGVGYVANRVTFIVSHFAGVHALRGPPYVITSRTLLATSLLLISIGSLVAASAKYLRDVRHYVALQRLRGLWSALRTEVPGVVLGDPPSRWSDLFAVRGLRLRLYRRVIEIRDAQLALLARVDPVLVDPVLVEACRLELAPAGGPAAFGNGADSSSSELDLEGEVAALLRLRAALRLPL